MNKIWDEYIPDTLQISTVIVGIIWFCSRSKIAGIPLVIIGSLSIAWVIIDMIKTFKK